MIIENIKFFLCFITLFKENFPNKKNFTEFKMTDIMHMLAQAQVKAQNQQNDSNVQQNDSVAVFFNSLASKTSSNNPAHQNLVNHHGSSLPIQIQQNSFTLETIERNIPKLSPQPPPNREFFFRFK